MDRRDFLLKAVFAGVGLAALPLVSRVEAFSGIGADGQSGAQEKLADYITTEEEAVRDILTVVDSWQAELPRLNVRHALMRQLVTEETGLSHEEFAARLKSRQA